jgi:hypothetical protein
MPVEKPDKELLLTVPELAAAVIALVAGPMSTQAVSVWLLLASVSEYFGCTIRSTRRRDAFVRLFEVAEFQSAYCGAVRSDAHSVGA